LATRLRMWRCGLPDSIECSAVQNLKLVQC
jgi:hypothetical protein